jgi:hypothetical protein
MKTFIVIVLFFIGCYLALVGLYHYTGRAAYDRWMDSQEKLRQVRERSKKNAEVDV